MHDSVHLQPAIRRALAKDEPAVLAINAMARPGVAPLDPRELERLFGMGATLTVAECGGAIAGYLIGFAQDAAYDGEEFRHFRGVLAKNFLYVDQVATHHDFRRRGIARALYGPLISSPEYDTVCCEVNLEPENRASLSFHRSLGFATLDRKKVQDGRTVALLVWDRNDAAATGR